MISAFDLFKIGIGPSSSHTVGPMVAARRFRRMLDSRAIRVRVELFGSLAWTGKGHGSDSAICLGLLDEEPSTVDPDEIAGAVASIGAAKSFRIGDGHHVAFDPGTDLIFDFVELLPDHSNGMR